MDIITLSKARSAEPGLYAVGYRVGRSLVPIMTRLPKHYAVETDTFIENGLWELLVRVRPNDGKQLPLGVLLARAYPDRHILVDWHLVSR